MELDLIPVFMLDIVQDVIADLTPRAQEKELSLELQVHPHLPHIQADAQRVRQILINLLDNAIKFTHTGSITVKLYPMASANGRLVDGPSPDFDLAEGTWLVISVKDTGIGIRPEDQQMIFDSFRQVDSSTTRAYEGTGLGLAITHQLVVMHGGHMWVESVPDEGSTFSVILPCILPEMPAAEPVIDDGEERPLVLVIDEDDGALQLVQDYLSEDAYHVVGTSSPAQALDLARKWRPVAVITDVIMPSANGWEVLRTLKGDPSTANIPVIVLSVVEQKTLAFYLGAADYLIKPVSRDALQESLARVARIEPKDPILIVDDNADDRALAAALLERVGYQVAMVEGGQAALEWLEGHSASLILLDLMMPVMSGFDVMAALSQDNTYRDIPVIVVTAKQLSEDELQQLRQNIAQVMQKRRLSGNSLVEQVQLALNKRARQKH